MPRSLSGELAKLGLAVVVGAVAITGYAALRIWQQGQVDERGNPVQAIVVLGAAQFNGVPSPVFRARLDHAVALYLEGRAERLVVTGGRQPGDRYTEAQTARAYALAHGVPPAAILAEDTGRDTWESMRNVAAIFEANGIERALFVSDRAHMLRVLRMAQDLGITAYGSPTATSPVDTEPSRQLDALVHELGALALYLFAAR